MKNIIAVRTELANVFQDLKQGKIKPAEAAELSNCAGKIINSLKVELEYHAARKETPVIEFFGKNDGEMSSLDYFNKPQQDMEELFR